MLRGAWIGLCRIDKLIGIKCMPEISIQVSVFLNSLPIIDGVLTIKVNADKIIKVVRNR